MLKCETLFSIAMLLAVASGSKSTSDPASVKYTLTAFAIGDWGTTLDGGSCCSGKFSNYDRNAESVVGTLMDIQAGNADAKPQAIIGHGDNFYWTGINSQEGRDRRFATTFEAKYDGDNIKDVPWVNVLGNHDYGGAAYICHNGDDTAQCNSTEQMLQELDDKFKWQSEYTSPNNDRWILKDHFYVHTIEDADSGCYGYAKGNDSGCPDVVRGDDYCCGGDTGMYDACYNKFAEWGNDSRSQLSEAVKASTATWKIVNNHFSPYEHYTESGMNKWFDVIRNSGIHAYLYGHTHGEKHNYSASLGIHFVENGAGGGFKKEAASSIPSFATKYVKNEWAYTPNEYGFFSLEASKDWLKLQYHTTDDKWVFTEKYENTTVGGVATKHCWYIPADGSEGKAC